MSNALKFKTVINGIKKTAETHFRTVYTVEKTGVAVNSSTNWTTKVTVPSFRGMGGGTETLAANVSYAEAVKAANDDYKRNGGR